MVTQKPAPQRSLKQQFKSVLTFARATASTATDWTELHNALFGEKGECTRRFNTPEERQAFLESPEGIEVWQLIERLREKSGTPVADVSGKFLVRLPKSIHAGLVAEAEAEGVSLNQLAVAKLSVQLKTAVVGGRKQ